MNSVLASLKAQFAGSSNITAKVGTRCSYLIELQDSAKPFIAYNLRQEANETKDGLKNFQLVIAIVAANIADLLQIYDAAYTVMQTETTDFLSEFEGGTFPEITEDDNYIIELNFNIKK